MYIHAECDHVRYDVIVMSCWSCDLGQCKPDNVEYSALGYVFHVSSGRDNNLPSQLFGYDQNFNW